MTASAQHGRIFIHANIPQPMETFLRYAQKVPFLGPLFGFSPGVHKRALVKAVVLWILGTSPILLAIVFSHTQQPQPDVIAELQSASHRVFIEFFSNDGIYAYTVAFIAPFLFIGAARIWEAVPFGPREGVRTVLMQNVFDGYWLCFLASALLLLVTALAFTSSLLSATEYKRTILFSITEERVVLFYLLSIYFWYLSILDELTQDSSYGDRFRANDQKALRDFEARLNAGGGQ
jgi:hypothetical protein